MNDEVSREAFIQAMAGKLAQLRAELLALSETRRESAATVELDQSRVGRLSRMDALQGQAMSQAGARRRQIELQRIAAALARIETGEYGYCTACGEPIAEARLRHNPATPLCIGCATASEART